MTPSRRRRYLVFAVVWVGCGNVVLGATPVDVYSPPVEVRSGTISANALTGSRLVERLNSNVPGATWANAPLRDIARQLAETYNLAIFLDGRLDPTVRISFDVANRSLKDVLGELAEKGEGEFRLVGNVAYFGPAEHARIVRTLAELRRRELSSRSGRRAADLLKSRTVVWPDLTEPASISHDVADRFKLRIENPEAIPHDLWAGAVFPEMDAADMLTLALIPFDMTFEWSSDFSAIRLIPLPMDRTTIGIERVYPSFRQLDETLADWKQSDQPVDTRPAGRNVMVRGPIELHELIDAVRPGRSGSDGRPAMAGSEKHVDAVPLARRQFTLAVSQVPASAIMQKLEESGIEFNYDAATLQSAGVDLNQPVSIDVKQADAATFFKAIFDPLGVKVTTRGVTVTLTPIGEEPRKQSAE